MMTPFSIVVRPQLLTALFTVLGTILITACGGGSSSKNNGSPKPTTPAATELLVQGGLLWDNVWDATDQTPITDPNPLYALRKEDPTTSQPVTQDPENTWRCKECHGWDYKGKDGAYGPGSSHYTGFEGLYSKLSWLTSDYVKRYVRDGRTTSGGTLHDFGVSGPQLSDEEIDALAIFILSGGIINTDLYIFPRSSPLAKAGKCDQGAGQTLFETGAPKTIPNCASNGCHGVDGKVIDFDSDPAAVEYVGTIAADNPWELLHKARFGQPGEPSMPAMLRWATINQSCDLMTYTQTLPIE